MKLIDKYLNEKFNYAAYAEKIAEIDNKIKNRSGAGSDYLGWENLPSTISEEEISKIEKYAEFVRKNFEFLVVCGIGGSYLGARAVIEAINGQHGTKKPKILFLGQTFSSDYIHDAIKHLKSKKFAVCVISKSGTTVETSISFRLLKETLIKQVGKKEAFKRIIAITDKEKGALRKIATKEGYVTFEFPSNIGGRFSVLSAVGLFPIAVAGIDIRKLLSGALDAEKDCKNPDILQNVAYKYAAIRNAQYLSGKSVEMFASYEPRLNQMGEWLKQLFGESEGKEGKGLFPTATTFSTDLHSLGQFIQNGSPCLFETVLKVKKAKHLNLVIPEDEDDFDNLNYLAGKSISFVNEKTLEGTLIAHSEIAKVPNIVLEIEKINEYNIGYLIYFFEKACAMSAYLLDVNPFDQPGVEVYKANMFHLLGKKGY